VVFEAEAEDSQYLDGLNSTTGAKEAVDLVSAEGNDIVSCAEAEGCCDCETSAKAAVV
jgi:hypothetical protein